MCLNKFVNLFISAKAYEETLFFTLNLPVILVFLSEMIKIFFGLTTLTYILFFFFFHFFLLSQPLDPASEEFERLKTYTKNTHAATHNMYDLEVLDVSFTSFLV